MGIIACYSVGTDGPEFVFINSWQWYRSTEIGFIYNGVTREYTFKHQLQFRRLR